jgi:hypothetical protein
MIVCNYLPHLQHRIIGLYSADPADVLDGTCAEAGVARQYLPVFREGLLHKLMINRPA